MTYGSLFSGIGGLDLGLDRAGWECRWQVEIDKYCRQVLEKHWPHVPRYDDITTLDGRELEPVDLIAGGFPCQDVSQAGRRTGLFDADGAPTRSGLWLEFARIVREVRPKLVLAENTPGILTLSRALARVFADLAGSGYVGLVIPLRASDFGAAHLRKRVFIIAIDGGGGKLAHAATGSERGIPAQYGTNPRRNVSRESDETGSGELGEDVAFREHAGRELRGEAYDHHRTDAPRNNLDGCDPNVAHRTPGGRRELREPSQQDGLANGSDAALADTAHDHGRGGNQIDEVAPLRSEGRGGIARDGGTLAHAKRARCDGREGAGFHSDGSPSQRTRSELRGGSLGDTHRGQREQRGRTEPHEGNLPGPDGGCKPVADAEHAGPSPRWAEVGSGPAADFALRSIGDLADAGNGFVPLEERRPEGRDGFGSAGADVSHAGAAGLPDAESPELSEAQRNQEGRTATELFRTFAPGPSDPRWPYILRERPDLAPAIESPVRGMADGLSGDLERAMKNRTKRLSRLGNAVVPDCAEYIGRKLLEFLC